MTKRVYDGLFFTPGEEEDSLTISFFDLKDEYADGVPIEGNDIGPKCHIAFFKECDDGLVRFDETFEAIFADPVTYVNGLLGGGLYGCILKKTTKSHEWFEHYLTRTKDRVTMLNTEAVNP